MSALPQALALAISAAFYPPALLVPLLRLAGRQPAAARTGLFRRGRDAERLIRLRHEFALIRSG
jgi:hypothetical protein